MNDKAKSIVGLVQNSVARMASLIDDVMDFARGRLGGGLALDRNSDEPIEPLLRHVIAELQTVAPDRVIEFTSTVTEPVDCDRRRVGQLVSNLLGNALTHGAADSAIRITADTADGIFMLTIANAGDPIPAAMLETIFEPFARGAHRPSLQGLGLGLYISHQIATAHGGTLEVVSTAAETRFIYKMPLEPH